MRQVRALYGQLRDSQTAGEALLGDLHRCGLRSERESARIGTEAGRDWQKIETVSVPRTRAMMCFVNVNSVDPLSSDFSAA